MSKSWPGGDGVVQLLFAVAVATEASIAMTVSHGRSWNQLTICCSHLHLIFFPFPRPLFPTFLFHFALFSLSPPFCSFPPNSCLLFIYNYQRNIIPWCPNFSQLNFCCQSSSLTYRVCTSMLYSGSTFWHYHRSSSIIMVGGEPGGQKMYCYNYITREGEGMMGEGQVSYLAAFFFLVHLSQHC